MDISIIVAFATKTRAIGKEGQLPWCYIKEDMHRFKDLTTSHFCVVGHNTFKTLPPLKGRYLIVLSKTQRCSASNAIFVSSINEAINIAKENGETELFCIGGCEVYKAFLPLADRLYITEVMGEYEGDAFFPVFDESAYKVVKNTKMANIIFKTYEKRIPRG